MKLSLTLGVLLALAAGTLCAQLPVARLSTIFPPGGKAGSAVEVTVSGADLDETTALHFSHAGIAGKLKEANKFTVTIAADVPPGAYEARVAGRYGVSNPRAFAVGDLPETTEAATNTATASALEIALGSLVNGRAAANAIDHFKFTAKPGQRILVDCQTRTIDSRMDAVLVLADSVGREVAHNRRGGLLDFTAPAEGQYLLTVHDFLYRGGEEYFYRLSVSVAPYLDFIFPPAGVAGTKGRLVVYGRNLPGGQPAKDLISDGALLEQLTVEIAMPADAKAAARPSGMPSSAVLDAIEYRLAAPPGKSNPVLLSFATVPVVVEQEPNSVSGRAQKISPPCEVAGHFYPAGDVDWFTFDAKKGDVYWLEVFSQRLGLPTSPFLLVQRVTKNDQGEEQAADVQELYESDANVGGNEFNTRSRDPAARFEAKADGAHRLQVRDLFNRTQGSPRHVYRLSVRRETPDFRLVALALPPPLAKKDAKDVSVSTPFLRRGETMPIKVLAIRRDNFAGEIQLTVDGLPAGVSGGPTRIEAGKNSALLFLTATEDAANWVGPIRITGKAKASDLELTRDACGGMVTWSVPDPANEPVPSRTTRDFVLAVSGREIAPLSIEAAENKVWEALADAKLKIPLKVTRRLDFTANLGLKPVGLSALDSLKEFTVDGKTNSAVLEIDLAAQKVPPGTHSFHLQALTQGKYRKDYAEVKAAEAAAKAAEKLAADLVGAAKQAGEATNVAAKVFAQAEAVAKAAADLVAAARRAVEQTPGDPDLVAASEAVAPDAHAAAAKAKAAADAHAAAEKAALEAAAKARDAETKKVEAAKNAKTALDKEKPKDVNLTVYSAPIRIKVLAGAKKK